MLQFKLNGFPIEPSELVTTCGLGDKSDLLIELLTNGYIELEDISGENSNDTVTLSELNFNEFVMDGVFKNDEEAIKYSQLQLKMLSGIYMKLITKVNIIMGTQFRVEEFLKSDQTQLIEDFGNKIRKKRNRDRLMAMTDGELRFEIKNELLENFKYEHIKLVKRDYAKLYEPRLGAGRSTHYELVFEGTIDEVLDYVIADDKLNERMRKL